MQIESLFVSNFKSIENIEITFEPLTIFIGANSSGKSNLVSVLRFIAHISCRGLDKAVALQGGIKYLTNANLPNGTPIHIKFKLDVKDDAWRRVTQVKNVELTLNKIDYDFEITPNLKGHGYKISYDHLSISYLINDESTSVQSESDIQAQYVISYTRNKTNTQVVPQHEIVGNDCKITKENVFNLDTIKKYFEFRINENRNELMLFYIAIFLPPTFSESDFIRIYDFDPRQLKHAAPMMSEKSLAEDGSNIANVLQRLNNTKENRDKLNLILKNILPFIQDIKTESNVDQSIIYKIKDTYSHKEFYANFQSDGTVSIIAMVIALYFESLSEIIVIEEPERNIHPQLISKLMALMEDVSRNKQIILTTHNSEVLRHTSLKNVRFIKRNEKGVTTVSKPEDSPTVKCFLSNDLGVDELFIQNVLGE